MAEAVTTEHCAALGRAFPDFDAQNSTSRHQNVSRSEYFEHLVVLWRNPVLGEIPDGFAQHVDLVAETKVKIKHICVLRCPGRAVTGILYCSAGILNTIPQVLITN